MAAAPGGDSRRIVRLDFLGPVRLRAAGREWPFGAERPLQLLLYLAVRATWVARDEATALFWPDKRNEDARRNLRRILHAVRRLDFAPQIEQRAELLRWSVDSDLAEFERTLDDGRATQAIALVRGPLGQAMEDPASERFNDWLAYERGRVGERWRTAVLALVPQLVPAAALEFAERLLATDPFDDEALRAKLAALAELGRTREVEPTFARYAERLAEELGVEANPATRTLATRLAAPLQLAPVAAPAASPPLDRSELIGRAAELEQVRSWLADDAWLEVRAGDRVVREVLERSWELAAPHEREVLAQLAVFVGGFPREAARAVAGASQPALANLAGAALLRVEPADGASRFRLHPLVREFARDKLAADAARHAAALDRHVDFHGRFLQRFAEVEKLEQEAALDAIGQELEDCLAAWRRAAAVRAADFFVAAAAPLENYFSARGRFADGIALFEHALGVLDPAEPAHFTAVAVTEASLAILQFRAGAIDAAEAGLRRTLSRARIGGLGRVRKSCLNTLALVMWQRARWDESKRLFAEALKFARADNDVEGIASFLGGIAMVEKAQGRLEVAARLYARVAAMARQSRNALGLTTTLNSLGDLFRLQGKLADARAAYGEALALADARGFDHHRAGLLSNLGLVAFAGNDLASAGVFAERALEAARANGAAQVEAGALGLRARVAVRRGDHAAAHALLAEALHVALATGIVPLQGMLLTWYGELLAAEGAPERAATIWNWAATDERNDVGTRQAARAMLAAVAEPERERGAELAARLRRDELLAEALRADAGGAAVNGPGPARP